LEDMDSHRGHRHRRNPSKHSILANIPDLMNKESAPKAFRFPRASSKTREVPIVDKEGEYEGKENLGERKSARPEKRVTWSKDLLQVRSISPRQKHIQQHRLASPRSSRINNTIIAPPSSTSSSSNSSSSSSYPSFASSFPSHFSSPSSSSSISNNLGTPRGLVGPPGTDCGHFLCQRVGRGSCQIEDSQSSSGGSQAQPWHGAGSQGTSTSQAHNSYGTSNPSYGTGHNPADVLPCSPQLKTVVWRSVPINRTGLSLDFRQSNVV